jgi:hypothetical protein
LPVANWITVDDLDDPEHDDAELAVEAATQVLWELSGRRFGGIRTIIETYCQLAPQAIPDLPVPVLHEGRIFNMRGGACGTCGCSHVLKLRGVPIIEIERVVYQGGTIPLSDVSVIDYSYLGMSQLAQACWNTCSDITVAYTYGAPPPALGKLAARELANQLIWSIGDDDRCTLPQRVTTISRQNTSWTLLDPQDFLDDGRTGIYNVDLFLRAVNPDKARRRARVFSPDLRKGRSRR